MKNQPFKEILPKLLNESSKDKIYNFNNAYVELGVLDIDVLERGCLVRLKSDKLDFKFASIHHLFTNIRNELSKANYAKVMPLRNSSRYNSESAPKIPAIQNSERKTVLIDPLLPYRNPVLELYKGGQVMLLEFDAQEYFFAPLKKNVKAAQPPALIESKDELL